MGKDRILVGRRPNLGKCIVWAMYRWLELDEIKSAASTARPGEGGIQKASILSKWHNLHQFDWNAL